MKLSKRIPSRNKTVVFDWIKKEEFMTHGFYKAARTKSRMKVEKKCWWCKKPFADEDQMALASVSGTGNKLLCQDCADEAISGGDEG